MYIPFGQFAQVATGSPSDPGTLYLKENFLGGNIEFTMDLSNADCGCAVSANLVIMASKHRLILSYGTWAQSTDGWYYCDAFSTLGQPCPTF